MTKRKFMAYEFIKDARGQTRLGTKPLERASERSFSSCLASSIAARRPAFVSR